jgi:hypothetical protein
MFVGFEIEVKVPNFKPLVGDLAFAPTYVLQQIIKFED